jgi:hypothetical protein
VADKATCSWIEVGERELIPVRLRVDSGLVSEVTPSQRSARSGHWQRLAQRRRPVRRGLSNIDHS